MRHGGPGGGAERCSAKKEWSAVVAVKTDPAYRLAGELGFDAQGVMDSSFRSSMRITLAFCDGLFARMVL